MLHNAYSLFFYYHEGHEDNEGKRIVCFMNYLLITDELNR